MAITEKFLARMGAVRCQMWQVEASPVQQYDGAARASPVLAMKVEAVDGYDFGPTVSSTGPS